MNRETDKEVAQNIMHGIIFYAFFAVVMIFLSILMATSMGPEKTTDNYSWIPSINNLLGIFPAFAYGVNLPSIAFKRYNRKIWHSILMGGITPFLFLWEDRNPLIFFVVLSSFPIFIPTLIIGITRKLEPVAGGDAAR
jgi:hypothetical protein